MIKAYRIVKTRFVSSASDGEGARLYGGRWNSKGVSMVYTAETLSGAQLEILVPIDSNDVLINRYSYVPIGIPKNLIHSIPLKSLPGNWDTDPPSVSTRKLGDEWCLKQVSAVLKVPNAITRVEHNYLINPAHPDFQRIEIHPPVEFRFDRRLKK
ncbi:MAG: RES domain-containing protein [Nitrospinaceae bacterium]|nr:RES domain-containing protein [Nitrospinaceae bacterium]